MMLMLYMLIMTMILYKSQNGRIIMQMYLLKIWMMKIYIILVEKLENLDVNNIDVDTVNDVVIQL